jgi:hypothetical protein
MLAQVFEDRLEISDAIYKLAKENVELSMFEVLAKGSNDHLCYVHNVSPDRTVVVHPEFVDVRNGNNFQTVIFEQV